jgi:hypothetical protein
MAINISHPTNTIDGQDVLNIKSGNESNIELNPDSGLVNVNGDINITGNFRVQGTTTTVNSTTTTIVDPIIALGTDEDGNPLTYNDGKDRGISFFYNNGSNKTGFFGFDASNNDFRFIPDATINSEIVSGNNGTITINRLNSSDVYTDALDVSYDASVHGNLTVDNNTTTTTLDAGDLNITTNVISSDISGDIVLDPGSDSINVSNSNIINLAEPNNSQDAATKNYVDSLTSAISVLNIAGDFGTGTVDLETGTFTLNGTEYQIETSVSNDVITFSLPTNLVVPGSLEVTTGLTVKGDAQIDGNLNVDGNITLGGNITIGDQTIDTVNVVADFTSNLIPQTDVTYDLGSTTKRWDNVYAGTVNADLIGNVTGNVTGQVSDISNHTTDELTEGESNLYFTEQRVKDTLSAGTGLTYNDGVYSITNTGVISGEYGDASNIPVITINAQGQITTVSTVSVAGVTNFTYNTDNGDLTISTADGGSYVATVTLDPFTTDNLTEGSFNKYYTSQRVRDELSAGTGVYYDSTNGVISIGQSVDTNSDVTFNSVIVATNTTTNTLDAGNLNITTNVISSDISGDIIIDSGADSIKLLGNTDVTGNFSVSNDAVIYGNLTVQGTTTSVNSTTVDIADLNLTLAKGSASSVEANGAGITVDGANATITYLSQTDTWNLNKTLNVDGDVNASSFYGNLTGNVTGQVSDISNHTTDELAEGETNLYYTTERTRSDVNAGTGLTYTQSIGEFKITDTGVTSGEYGDSSNIPIITVNAQGQITAISTTAVAGVVDFTYDTSNGDLTISTADNNSFVATVTLDPFTTTNLVEGNNLYYTSSRANEDFDTRLATKTTTDLTEGINLYYTTERVRLSLNAIDAGGDGSFTYDNATGEFTYTGPSASETQAHFNAGTGLTYDAGTFSITNTGVISGEYGNSSNIPVITINEQGQITSVTTTAVAGVTDFQYNTTNGDLTISTADGDSFVATVTLDPFTTDNLNEGSTNKYYTSQRVRDELSAGTGVYYDSETGVISIGQWVDTDSDVTFNSVSVATNTTTTTLDAGDLNITTNVISSDIAGDIIIESGSDNIELIGNTNVTGDLNVSGMIYGDLTGYVTGQVSDISNHTTTELTEGTNLYFTDTRARLAVSATDAGGDGSFSYNNSTGVFTYTGPSASETQAHFTAGTGLTYNAGEFSITNTTVTAGSYGDQSSIPVLTINAQGQITSASTVAVAGVTDFTYDSNTADLTISTADGNSFVATVDLNPFSTSNLVEGSRLYYLDSRARSAVSATKVSGFGDLTYNDANGVFSYTGPSSTEILNLLNAGTGVYFDYGTGTISIGQAVDTTSDVQFNNVDTVTLDAGNLNITTNVISSDIAGDIIIDSGADTIQLIGDTDVTGNFSVSANAIIYGDLTVQGTTTSINTTDTEISDNVITLNQGETGAGVSKGTSGIEVARGSLFNASWKWNEITGRWEAKEGSNLTAIAVAEINAGNVNIANNTIVPTNTNGDLNLNSNGTGKVLINGKQAATDTDALMYAIVFGG